MSRPALVLPLQALVLKLLLVSPGPVLVLTRSRRWCLWRREGGGLLPAPGGFSRVVHSRGGGGE